VTEFLPALEISAPVMVAALVLFASGVFVGWLFTQLSKTRQMERLNSALELEKKMNQERLSNMEKTFTALSANALQNNNRAFIHLAQQVLGRFQVKAQGDLDLKHQAIAGLIQPVHETLARAEAQLANLEQTRREGQGSLNQQLESMIKSQDALQLETRNLVKALSRPEVRGQWGELTLRRLVELAGMVDRCDFEEQVHTRTEDGALRPDMLVHLPGNRQIVVDVKTPLDAYLSAIESVDTQARDQHLKRHARHLRERVKELATKRYWDQFERAPEFVVLFIPGEQFLTAALDLDRSLLEDALAQRVILTTPTSLVAVLRAVAYGWRQETLSKNAGKILEIGRSLHQRIGTLAEHLNKLGKNLDASVRQFNRMVGSFESNVLPAARRFTDLGVSGSTETPHPEAIETRTRETNAND
jgi:DNA recombination protein RmuC